MKTRKKSSPVDRVYSIMTALLSSSAFLFFFIILGVLLYFSYPSEVVNGLKFLTTNKWNTPDNNPVITVDGFKELMGAAYGIYVPFLGTLIISAMAIVIGVPLSLGIAVIISQYSPKLIAAPASFLIELLAGIPSVIYGLWALVVLSPFLVHDIEPSLAKYLGFIPGVHGPVTAAPGLLASGLILAIMIVPIVASISRDAMAQTPRELKEGGRALGLTRWEVTTKIIFPFAKSGIIGSIILGLGRALGETMAVAMVCGGAGYLPTSIYGTINAMAAFIALNFTDAGSDVSGMTTSALAELALLLLATTMIVNVIARLMVRRGFISHAEHMIQV